MNTTSENLNMIEEFNKQHFKFQKVTYLDLDQLSKE